MASAESGVRWPHHFRVSVRLSVFFPREEMSQGGSVSRNLLLATYVYGQVPGHLPNEEVSGMTDPMVYFESADLSAPPISDSARVGLRLALIGDEMDLWLRTPRLVQLAGLALTTVHSLVFNHIQTGVRSVFRSFNSCLTNLRESMWARRLLARRNWVCPHQVCQQVLPSLLLLLLGVLLHLILPK
nr:bcl-2-interacting killer isoform X2 [Loxodonta africana]